MTHLPSNLFPLGPGLVPTLTGWQSNLVPTPYHPLGGVGSGPGHPRTTPYFKYNTPNLSALFLFVGGRASAMNLHDHPERPMGVSGDDSPTSRVPSRSRGERGALGSGSAPTVRPPWKGR